MSAIYVYITLLKFDWLVKIVGFINKWLIYGPIRLQGSPAIFKKMRKEGNKMIFHLNTIFLKNNKQTNK